MDDKPSPFPTQFYGRGRRIKKVVTNSGELDGTMVIFYDQVGAVVETRDGSANVSGQFIVNWRCRLLNPALLYIRPERGQFYVHSDAVGNIIALTDLGGSVVERYVYTPHGELTVHQDTSYGDRDGDSDVDSIDKGTVGTTCTGTVSGACRILDLDFDGDYDSTDATKFDALAQGLARHPGKTSTGVNQPFAHQGLLYEPEITSYQNRARQLSPSGRRFQQRDPAGFVDGLSNYSYVNNKVPNSTDSFGLFASSTEVLPDRIQIVVDLVFWGWGVANYPQTDPQSKSIPRWHEEPTESWNFPASEGKGAYTPSARPTTCRPIQFRFPSTYLSAVPGPPFDLDCNTITQAHGEYGGKCAEAITNTFPKSVSVWVMQPSGVTFKGYPNFDPGGGGGVNIPQPAHPYPPGPDFRHVRMRQNYFEEFLPPIWKGLRVFSHEVGHVLGHLSNQPSGVMVGGNLGSFRPPASHKEVVNAVNFNVHESTWAPCRNRPTLSNKVGFAEYSSRP